MSYYGYSAIYPGSHFYTRNLDIFCPRSLYSSYCYNHEIINYVSEGDVAVKFLLWMSVLLLTTINLSIALRGDEIGTNSTCSMDIDGTCFGHALKSKYFLLGDNFCNLNHGSFGAVPKPVADQQHTFFVEQESHPDNWFRNSYFDYVEAARKALASLVNADADDLVLVENASSAVNSILRSLGLRNGDKILRLSTAYGMVTNTLAWLQGTVGVEVVVVDVVFPVVDANQIISAVIAALEEHSSIKVCIFSHISSIPAMIEPVKALTAIAHKYQSLSLIDGAHAPGVLDIDIKDISADFYLGNCHKWLYAPKGTAFLWVAKSQQMSNSPEPTVISSSGDLTYTGRYKYTGTRDYTGFSSIPLAVNFIDRLGGLKQVQSYNHNLAIAAAKYLSLAWRTSLLVPEEMSGYMVNVILPSNNATAIASMQLQLDKQYDIYMVYSSVITSSNDEIFFTRLSAQVYLELSDFEQLGDLVPQLLSG